MNPRSTALSLIFFLATASTSAVANQPTHYMTSDGQVLEAGDPRLANYQILPGAPKQEPVASPDKVANKEEKPEAPKPPPPPTQDELDEMLFVAAKAGNTGRVRGLVERGANPMAGTRGGETPLHAAASRGHLQPIIYLANHGGNVNAKTVKGWTPLHHAARFGHKRAVEYLLRMGSIPHLRTSDLGQKSPMEMAVDNKYFEIALLFGYRPRPGEMQ